MARHSVMIELDDGVGGLALFRPPTMEMIKLNCRISASRCRFPSQERQKVEGF